MASCRGRTYVGLFMLVTMAGCAMAPTVARKQAADQFCRTIMKPRRDVCVASQVPTGAAAVQAADLPPASDALTIYILRNNSADPTEAVRLEVGGQALTDTLPRTFVRVRLPPGKHALTVGWRSSAASHTVQGLAGEVRYLQLTGWAFMGNREFGLKDIERNQALELVRSAAFLADLVPHGSP